MSRRGGETKQRLGTDKQYGRKYLEAVGAQDAGRAWMPSRWGHGEGRGWAEQQGGDRAWKKEPLQ